MRVPFRSAAAWLTALSLLWLIGCSDNPDLTEESIPDVTVVTERPDASTDGQLKVGILVPTTGEGEGIGTSIRNAAVDEIKEINKMGGVLGKTVAFKVADEDNEAAIAELLNENVDAIVGPTSSLVALRRLSETIDIPHPVPTCSPTASALSLDGFDDRGYFFRTVASDALQMVAIANEAQRTGLSAVMVAYVDDPYGRDLFNYLQDEISDRERLELRSRVPIAPDEEDLTASVSRLVDNQASTIVILSNQTLGGRLLRAIDRRVSELPDNERPTVLVNDSVSTARQAISELTVLRNNLRAITVKAEFDNGDRKFGPFAAQATDCVDLFALAATLADSDARAEIRSRIGSISSSGSFCDDFESCSRFLANGRQIDYSGRSGPLDLDSAGNPKRAQFQLIRFNDDGTVERAVPFAAGVDSG